MKKFEKVMMVICVVIALWVAHDTFFGYEYVTEEVRWPSNKLLWEVANDNVGPHEDVREVIDRIERDNPGAKPGDVIKVEIKVRR